jgi:hypothetical protein
VVGDLTVEMPGGSIAWRQFHDPYANGICLDEGFFSLHHHHLERGIGSSFYKDRFSELFITQRIGKAY